MPYRFSLILGLISSVWLVGCQQEPEPAAVVRPVLVAQPQVGVSHNESFPGEVRARFEPELAFRIGGKVTERLVDVGARVKQGQPLAKLDAQDVDLQLQSARAQVSAAQSNLALVKAERDRYLKLKQRQLASQSHFDNADTQYKTALASLKQAQAQYDVAKNQSSYSTLYAPADGVISMARLEVGQVVAAGQTVFVLAADGEREVVIGLPEQTASQFKVGNAVKVELWSNPEQKYEGSIREISPAADPRSRTFAARVSFSADNSIAEIGQSARVYAYKTTRPTLKLPLSAVTAENNQPYVWRVVANPEANQQLITERVAIKTGAFSETEVSVLAGLQTTDWVVTGGVQLLQAGQVVTAVDRDNRPVHLGEQESADAL